ncbi:MAG: hypothetical protein ACRD7E_30445 [Bryobacteraceae bacterium]
MTTFQQLPTKFDIHEWAIMQDFSRSMVSERDREDLLNAIHGAAEFQHFKDPLRRHQIEAAWFTFRDKVLRRVARLVRGKSHRLAASEFSSACMDE